VLVTNDVFEWPKERWLGIARPASGLILLAVMLWRRPMSPAGLPAAAFDLTLAQLLIATAWFQPWYLVPLLGLAAASADRRRQALGLIFAASATASYLVYFYLWTTPWWGRLSLAHVQILAAAVVYLPPIAYCVVRIAYRRTRTTPVS
jgi:hypothetical protein